MNAVPYRTVLNDAADLLGWDPDNLAAAEFRRLARAINRRARFAYDRFWWPEWTYIDERTVATATDNSIYVPFAQTDKSTIHRLKQLWSGHPERDSTAVAIPSRRRSDGWAVLTSGYTTVWAEYRTEAPVWLGNVWVSGTSYASGVTVFYGSDPDGDFYLSTSGSNTATPTDTSKWTKLEFPQTLWLYCAVAAAGDIKAKTEEQPQNLAGWEREHWDMLLSEFDALEREEGLVDPLNVRTM